MGWLRGSTDITNFRADLYALLTGGMAAGQRGSGQAGNGVTLSVADRWSGLDATNFVVRSQTLEAPFTNEYAVWRGAPRFAARSNSTVLAATHQLQIGRPTFSGAYSGVTVRAYFHTFASVSNSAPGNLSGLQISWTLVNADTGAAVTSGTATGWTGSSDTRLLVQGVSLTLTLQPTESFIAGSTAVAWMRAYTTTLTDGIDYFPEAAQIASGLTLSNSSGGPNNYTSGVDYDLVQQAHIFPQVSTTIGYHDAAREWGGSGAGCGIHWRTGGAPVAVGVNYFVPATYQMYAGYYQVPNVVSIGGNFSLTGAPIQFWDATLAAGRNVMTNGVSPKTSLNTTLSYAQLFTGAGQAGSTFINFWISATASKLVMAFRGDTGQSGRLVVLTFQRYTSMVTSDKWPWVFLPDGSASASNGGAHLISSKLVYEQPYWGSPGTSPGVINLPMYHGPQPTGTAYQLKLISVANDASPTANTAAIMPRQNPNNWDLRWWLYSLYNHANLGGSNLIGTFDALKAQAIRGKLRGIFAVANDNFTSLDELVDASTTYLLVIPTTLIATSQGASFTAVALAEE